MPDERPSVDLSGLSRDNVITRAQRASVRVSDRHAALSARALWAGPGARRALAAGGRGTVEFALHPGGYARLGDAWLLLAIPRAPRGPLTLLVAGLEAAPLAAGDEVEVERPVSTPTPSRTPRPPVPAPPRSVPPARRPPRPSQPPPPRPTPPPPRPTRPCPTTTPLPPTPPPRAPAPRMPRPTHPVPRVPRRRATPAPQLAAPGHALTDERRLSQPLVVQLDARVLRAGALRVDLSRIGRPPLALVVPPLSPGWRLALTAALEAAPGGAARARRRARRAAPWRRWTRASPRSPGAGTGSRPPATTCSPATRRGGMRRASRSCSTTVARCSPLGLAYLRCAERGELPEPVAALMRAIRAGDPVAAERRARALSRWGASSGAAMLWGIAAAASS